MLLHWYAAKVDAVPAEERSGIKKFSYETRISSRRFCALLQEKEITIPASTCDNALKEAIRNCICYRSAWDNDPSISALRFAPLSPVVLTACITSAAPEWAICTFFGGVEQKYWSRILVVGPCCGTLTPM